MLSKNVIRKYNSEESEEVDRIIIESYDDFVRLERRNLLLISMLVIFAGVSGLNPKAGSILGFTFNNLTENVFYLILLSLIIYFIVAFVTFSFPSFKKSLKQRKEILSNSHTLDYSTNIFDFGVLERIHGIRFYTWLAIYFILPVFLGVLSAAICIVKIA